MSVNLATGDLFKPGEWTITQGSKGPTVDCIGHGVNCKGAMGSGIAVPFKTKYPLMYVRYKEMCDKNYLLPGMMMPFKTQTGGWIFNIASQYHPGPNAHIEYLRLGLRYSRFFMEYAGLKHLGLPRIGAGIGGLSLDDVIQCVNDEFRLAEQHVTVVSLEGA